MFFSIGGGSRRLGIYKIVGINITYNWCCYVRCVMEKRAKNSQEFFEEEKKKVLTIIGEHSKKKPPGQKKILARTAKNEYGIDKNAMHALFNSVTPVAVPRIDYDNHPAYVS